MLSDVACGACTAATVAVDAGAAEAVAVGVAGVGAAVDVGTDADADAVAGADEAVCTLAFAAGAAATAAVVDAAVAAVALLVAGVAWVAPGLDALAVAAAAAFAPLLVRAVLSLALSIALFTAVSAVLTPEASSGGSAVSATAGGGFSTCTWFCVTGTASMVTGAGAAVATGTIKAGIGGNAASVDSSSLESGVDRTTVFR